MSRQTIGVPEIKIDETSLMASKFACKVAVSGGLEVISKDVTDLQTLIGLDNQNMHVFKGNDWGWHVIVLDFITTDESRPKCSDLKDIDWLGILGCDIYENYPNARVKVSISIASPWTGGEGTVYTDSSFLYNNGGFLADGNLHTEPTDDTYNAYFKLTANNFNIQNLDDIIPSYNYDRPVRAINFSIYFGDDDPSDGSFPVFSMSSIVLGSTYKFPHSVDLSHTNTVEFGGVKVAKSDSGAETTNAQWVAPPNWGKYPAYQVNFNTTSGVTSRVNQAHYGKRSWSLNFSYINSENMYNVSQQSDAHYDIEPATSNSFMDLVWNKIQGRRFAFIFNYNPSSTLDATISDTAITLPNPDTYVICRFKSNKLKAQQTAPSLYRTRLNIVETW